MDSKPTSVTACTFIGGGVLAKCLIDGLVQSGDTSSWRSLYHVRVTARREEHVKQLRHRYPGAIVSGHNQDPILWENPWENLPGGNPDAHIILICVQPEFTKSVCGKLREVGSEYGWSGMQPIFVTMCPGITMAQLQLWLPRGANIIRTMPNTPVSVSQGATALYANENTKAQAVEQVVNLFKRVSPVVSVLPHESLIDVSAAASGSAPAYVYLLMASLVEAGMKNGLPQKQAVKLVKQTVFGAAQLALADDRPLQNLIDDVCVPGGSTEKAMSSLTADGFTGSVVVAAGASLMANRAMGQFL